MPKVDVKRSLSRDPAMQLYILAVFLIAGLDKFLRHDAHAPFHHRFRKPARCIAFAGIGVNTRDEQPFRKFLRKLIIHYRFINSD